MDEINPIDRNGVLEVEVADNGKGFAVEQRKPGSWGLLNMEERALAIGGKLTVESAIGAGTRIRVRVAESASGADIH